MPDLPNLSALSLKDAPVNNDAWTGPPVRGQRGQPRPSPYGGGGGGGGGGGPRPQRRPSQVDDQAEDYTWGVMPVGSNIALNEQGLTDRSLPDRATLKELFEEPNGLCETCISLGAIESIRDAINMGRDVVFVLNGYNNLVGALVLGHEHVSKPDLTTKSVKEWVSALKVYATTKTINPNAGGLQRPKAPGLMSGPGMTIGLNRFEKMDKIQGMVTYVEWACTASRHPHNPNITEKPRGAGKALLEGLESCIRNTYVEAAARQYVDENWAGDFDNLGPSSAQGDDNKMALARTTIEKWCFAKLEAIPQAMYFWMSQGFEEIEPGKIVAGTQNNRYLYRNIFGHR